MAIHPVTLNRRATDAGEPTNRAILDKLDDLENALELYIKEHGHEHATLDRRLGASDTATAVADLKLRNVELATLDVALLHDFKVQVQTIGASIKWIVGGSFLALLASIAALIASFGHIIQSGP